MSTETKELSADELYAVNTRKRRKLRLKKKLLHCLTTYKNCLVVTCDNVGSRQMQEVRIACRGRAELLMGKNTVFRKIFREQIKDSPNWEPLIALCRGNTGFIFTNESVADIRKVVLESKVPAAAKSGQVAPIDVVVPAGPTGLDPGQTAFFQAVNIGTKIARGSIEIVNDVQFLNAGDKVTSSHVALLSKLNIKPFFYGFKTTQVLEDGEMFDASVLDFTAEQLKADFIAGVRRIAAIGLEIGIPNKATVGPSLRNGFKKLLAITSQVEGYTFAEAKEFFGDDSGSDSDSDSNSDSNSDSGEDGDKKSGSGSSSGSSSSDSD